MKLVSHHWLNKVFKYLPTVTSPSPPRCGVVLCRLVLDRLICRRRKMHLEVIISTRGNPLPWMYTSPVLLAYWSGKKYEQRDTSQISTNSSNGGIPLKSHFNMWYCGLRFNLGDVGELWRLTGKTMYNMLVRDRRSVCIKHRMKEWMACCGSISHVTE